VVHTESELIVLSNGNTVLERLVQDSVQMMTAYSEKDGELVAKNYCALGTEPEVEVEMLNGTSIPRRA
jgi:hypothetical protein|tara:strand:+ start:704 stop:907 length:204 start_codon:yes stop_codon:yes gene_type:complete